MNNECTRQIKKAVIPSELFDSIVNNELNKRLKKVAVSKIENYILENPWVKIKNENNEYYWSSEYQIMFLLRDEYVKYNGEKDILDFSTCYSMINGDTVLPEELVRGIKNSVSVYGNHWIAVKEGSVCLETGQFADWKDGSSVYVPIVKTSRNSILKNILYGNCSCLDKNHVVDLYKGLQKNNEYLIKNFDRILKPLKIDKSLIENEVRKEFSEGDNSEIIKGYFLKYILECDKIRADLDVYDPKIIEDVNQGSWELWDTVNKADEKTLELKEQITARNPESDIHYDGLIGIDFGTKSTIVSRKDGNEKTRLVRVGTGEFAELSGYENPTIMEFVDLSEFLEKYNSRSGRPYTEFNDLKVSYRAYHDLCECRENNDFYSFFYDIKQWCAKKNKSQVIKDQKLFEITVPAFENIDCNSFNPLEIYAYYLGMCINNMHNGIYLDYILSFPVTYERKIKDKIVESFKNGLMKSLPETVLNNTEIMSKYRVRQGVSEPAAYAITALQQYNLDPMAGEVIMYAIFDFGGGTTDFDFGIWRASNDTREEQRYDYVIEHFGAEGDRFLGGENLLGRMAYEIFKQNCALINSDENEEIDFSKPEECDFYDGAEKYISDSQEAKRNTKVVMEALRPFWEGIIRIADENDKDSVNGDSELLYNGYVFRNDHDFVFPVIDDSIVVDLFDKNGKLKKNIKLYLKNSAEGVDIGLVDIIETRIETGVKHFFNTLNTVYEGKVSDEENENQVHIFLAGNSSKSPVLHKIINEYITRENKRFKEEKEIHYDYYSLYPALGTAEAFRLQQEYGVSVDENDLSAPNGKTGVAYGLIAGREGGKIKVISEIKDNQQAKFRYNIGIEKRNSFIIKLDRNKVNYGEWVKLIDAGVEDFEIYYTSLPGASSIKISDEGVYKKSCRLPYTDISKDVFIRTVEDNPEDIEYCISDDSSINEVTEVFRVSLGTGKG